MTTNLPSILTATAAALAVSLNLHAGSPGSANRALAHSPRYIEEHPELIRGTARSSALHEVKPESVGTKLTTNRALAASPRYLEEFPGLARVDVASRPGRDANDVPSEVLQNKAFVASPRVQEQFPSLMRGRSRVSQSGRPLQIAPVK